MCAEASRPLSEEEMKQIEAAARFFSEDGEPPIQHTHEDSVACRPTDFMSEDFHKGESQDLRIPPNSTTRYRDRAWDEEEEVVNEMLSKSRRNRESKNGSEKAVELTAKRSVQGFSTDDSSFLKKSNKRLHSKVGSRGGVADPFPIKLHRMLERAEVDGISSIVCWKPHGRAFVVLKSKEFVKNVMPKYFKQTKITSFQRQLNLYGFSRLTRGLDTGAYYHELFLRGRPVLCRGMIRTKVKGTGHKACVNPETEPNFYAMMPVSRLGDGHSSLPLIDENISPAQVEPEKVSSNLFEERVLPSVTPSQLSMPKLAFPLRTIEAEIPVSKDTELKVLVEGAKRADEQLMSLKDNAPSKRKPDLIHFDKGGSIAVTKKRKLDSSNTDVFHYLDKFDPTFSDIIKSSTETRFRGTQENAASHPTPDGLWFDHLSCDFDDSVGMRDIMGDDQSFGCLLDCLVDST